MEHHPPYKTAADLGIELWEHDGLVALVGPLSRGELALDMRKPKCGAVGCIGGHLAAKRGLLEASYVHRVLCDMLLGVRQHRLADLFYPGHYAGLESPHRQGWDASSPQAAHAIVNYLVTGDPQWDRVMTAPTDAAPVDAGIALAPVGNGDIGKRIVRRAAA